MARRQQELPSSSQDTGTSHDIFADNGYDADTTPGATPQRNINRDRSAPSRLLQSRALRAKAKENELNGEAEDQDGENTGGGTERKRRKAVIKNEPGSDGETESGDGAAKRRKSTGGAGESRGGGNVSGKGSCVTPCVAVKVS